MARGQSAHRPMRKRTRAQSFAEASMPSGGNPDSAGEERRVQANSVNPVDGSCEERAEQCPNVFRFRLRRKTPSADVSATQSTTAGDAEATQVPPWRRRVRRKTCESDTPATVRRHRRKTPAANALAMQSAAASDRAAPQTSSQRRRLRLKTAHVASAIVETPLLHTDPSEPFSHIGSRPCFTVASTELAHVLAQMLVRSDHACNRRGCSFAAVCRTWHVEWTAACHHYALVFILSFVRAKEGLALYVSKWESAVQVLINHATVLTWPTRELHAVSESIIAILQKICERYELFLEGLMGATCHLRNMLITCRSADNLRRSSFEVRLSQSVTEKCIRHLLAILPKVAVVESMKEKVDSAMGDIEGMQRVKNVLIRGIDVMIKISNAYNAKLKVIRDNRHNLNVQLGLLTPEEVAAE